MARNSRHGRWGQCLSERQPNEPKTSRRRKCLTLDQFPYIRSTPLSQYPHRRCLNSKTRLTCANYNSETLEFRSKATASPNDPAMMLNETAAVMRRSQPRTRTRSRRKTGSAREDSFASQRLRAPSLCSKFFFNFRLVLGSTPPNQEDPETGNAQAKRTECARSITQPRKTKRERQVKGNGRWRVPLLFLGRGQGEGTDEDERTNERIKIWCSVLARWGKSNYCELNGN